MNIEYFEFSSRDELTLVGKKMTPKEEPTAILCLIHGFGEHQERYHHVGEALTQNGIALFTFDLRGHGKSEGKRGHSKKHSYLIDDVEEIVVEARKAYNDTPIYLMGHSFGGHLVANFLLDKKSNEIKGAILSSPWFKLAFEPAQAKVRLANLMAKIYPAYSDTSEMDISKLSRDETIIKSYENDPLVLNTITAGLFSSILKANEWILANAHNLKTPTLLYHGTADQIISINGSEQFAADAGEHLIFEKLKGVYHEPHNDLGKEKVLKRMIDWIKQ